MTAVSNNNTNNNSDNSIKNLDDFRKALAPYIQALGERQGTIKARLAFLNIFYAGLRPSTQSLSGKTKELVLSIPENSRTLPLICQRLYEEEIIQPNFLKYFFQIEDGHKFIRNACFGLFSIKEPFKGSDGFLICHSEPALDAMCSNCQNQIEINRIEMLSEEKQNGFITILTQAINGLVDVLGKTISRENLVKTMSYSSKAITLARLIASFSILDPQSTKTLGTQLKDHPHSVILSIWGQSVIGSSKWKDQVREGIMAFRNAKFDYARECFVLAEEKVQGAKLREKTQLEYSQLLSYMGHLELIKGDKLTAKKLIDEACSIKDQDGRSMTCARAYYERAYYHLFYEHNVDIDAVISDLDISIDFDCIDAILLKADILLHGKGNVSPDLESALTLINQVINSGTAEEKRRGTDLQAQYYAVTGNSALAASLGHWDSILQERQKYFAAEKRINLQLGELIDKKICFFSEDVSNDGSMNYVLLSSLKDESASWRLETGSTIDILTTDPSLLNHKRIYFSFLSKNETKNLEDLLETIKLLNDVAAQQAPSARQAFIDRIDMYILSYSETATLLIDAAMGNLAENIYFKVHLCNPDIMAANELVLHHPTFIPCIPKSGSPRKGEKRRIVLIGDTKTSYVILKQIIATTYLSEYPTELTVIGPRVDKIQKLFFENCPELSKRYEDMPYINPRFVPCEIDALPINRFSSTDDSTDDLHSILHQANYFIVAGGNDFDNIACAIKLRTNLLKNNPDPDMRPYIAVRYQNRETSWLASQVAISSRDYTTKKGAAYKYYWHESYDLHLFGSTSAFEYKQLFNNFVEGQALKLHKSYYGTPINKPNPTAEGAFYKRTYNRDSSIAAFLGIIYQCFGMGVYHHNAQEYAADLHSELKEKYEIQLFGPCINEPKETDIHDLALLEKAAGIEHSRWMGYCASRGWTKPDENMISTYLRQGNPRHHLEIGLLHPYLVKYEQLEREWERLNRLISQHNTQIQPLPDPRIPDREFVLKAPLLLGDSPSIDAEEVP